MSDEDILNSLTEQETFRILGHLFYLILDHTIQMPAEVTAMMFDIAVRGGPGQVPPKTPTDTKHILKQLLEIFPADTDPGKELRKQCFTALANRL